MALEIRNLTGSGLRQLKAHRTVFIFPVGPMEQHGANLPLDLKLRFAEHSSQLLAHQIEKAHPEWTAVLMPSVPFGIQPISSHFSITVRAHVLKDWLVDACKSLKKSGFSKFLCVSGSLSPRQLTAIEEAGKAISTSPFSFKKDRTLLLSVNSCEIQTGKILASPFWPDEPEHGAYLDISTSMAVAPKLDYSFVEAVTDLPRDPSFLSRMIQRFTKRTPETWGPIGTPDPNEMVNNLIAWSKQVAPKIIAVLEGTPPRSTFRSWYSVLPPNWALFRAWIWALLVACIFSAWIWLTWRDVLS